MFYHRLVISSAQLEAVSPYQPQGDIFVTIQLVDDLNGEAFFGFFKELALHLLQTMTGMELTEVDELVQSALCELTNISCCNAGGWPREKPSTACVWRKDREHQTGRRHQI